MANLMEALEARGFGAGSSGMSQTTQTIIIVFLAISICNVIELGCMIFCTFKRCAGVYFWSFLVATGGVTVSIAGFFAKFFGPASIAYLSCTLGVTGWICMVTGQSMVLWSRLHLVMDNKKRLRLILWMIIIDAVLCHGAVIPMVFGSFSSHPEIWQKPYTIMEKIEVTVFFVQEVILSGLYILETFKLLKLQRTCGSTKSKESSRRLMKQLILVNVLIICLDTTILSLEYANEYNYQITYKIWVYSMKLKLEFTILNRLAELATVRREATSFLGGGVPTDGVSQVAYAGGEGLDNKVEASPTRNDSGVMVIPEITIHDEEEQDNGRGSKSSANSTVVPV